MFNLEGLSLIRLGWDFSPDLDNGFSTVKPDFSLALDEGSFPLVGSDVSLSLATLDGGLPPGNGWPLTSPWGPELDFTASPCINDDLPLDATLV